MPLTVILGVGVSHKVQATICLAFTIVPMTCRIMLLPLGVAALLSLPGLVILRLGVLGTIRVAYFTRATMSVPMSLQWRLSRPNFSFKGANRQLPSNVRTAVSALMRSDECKISETRRS